MEFLHFKNWLTQESFTITITTPYNKIYLSLYEPPTPFNDGNKEYLQLYSGNTTTDTSGTSVDNYSISVKNSVDILCFHIF